MNGLLNKKQILTLPNLLSLIRLCLIPLIVWLYCGAKKYITVIFVILLSGATDIADGIIARKFSMISDFGKILDPIADKLTQAAMLICLLSRYKLMWVILSVFAIREIVMIVMGMIVIKKKDSVNSAKWYGKLNTVVLYTVMMLLILLPNIPIIAANSLLIFCGITIILSLVLYARFYFKILISK